MTTGLKSAPGNQDLNDKLKSLRIDRSTRPAPGAPNRTPKKRSLALSALIALIAIAYAYFSASPKTVAVAAVKTESGTAAGATALTGACYFVAPHKIAVRAKVMGRGAWTGAEHAHRVQQ